MTARPDATKTARQAVTELAEIVTWLAASLLPGTARPWQPPQMSAEKRAELDAKARLERHATSDVVVHEIVPLGESPAPMDLDVMDLLVDCLTAADELAVLVADSARSVHLPAATSAYADPTPYLNLVLDQLGNVGRCTEACALPGGCGHPLARDVLATVHARCESLVFRARSQLGLVTDGQLLDARCPWCDGRTSKHPVGGAKTLRVKVIPLLNRTTRAEEQVPVVTCEGGSCSVPASDFGVTHHGRPVWVEGEWAWLAQRIEVHAEIVATVEEVVAGLAS